jgi:hypothetical protein
MMMKASDTRTYPIRKTKPYKNGPATQNGSKRWRRADPAREREQVSPSGQVLRLPETNMGSRYPVRSPIIERIRRVHACRVA